MRHRAMYLVLTSLVLALLPAGTSSAHGGSCARVTGTASSQLSSGERKGWTTFSDSNNSSGVPNTFLSDDDFGQRHCSRSMDGDKHFSRLYDETSGCSESGCDSGYNRPMGDLSIYRLHSASGGQTYSLGASMNLWNLGGDFRGVVKLTAWTQPDTCLRVNNACWEKIAKICKPGVSGCDKTDTENYQGIQIGGTLPSGTNYVKFVYRARAATVDAYGTAGIDSLWYCRC